MADEEATIVIKKINKGGHGHHGGAWKVAYADFVTAMMAFFLLLWLLNATEAENLAGLADYFAPTVGVKGKMGIGFRGGKSALSKGIGADKNTNRGIVHGGVPAGPIMKVTEKIEIVTQEADSEKVELIIGESSSSEESEDNAASFEEVAEALQEHLQEVAEESEIETYVDVEVSPEGLLVQIKDTEKETMFETGTTNLRPHIQTALQKLAEVLGHLPHYISITGHTSSAPIQGRSNYSNWELSSDRANSTRRFLIRSGVQPEQIAEVIGKSDNEPLDAKRPEAPINNRISIVLLKQALGPEHKKAAPEKVFIDTDSTAAEELRDAEETPGEETPPEEVEEQAVEANEEIQEVFDPTEVEEEEVLEEETVVEDPFEGGEEAPAPVDLFLEDTEVEEDVILDTPGAQFFEEEEEVFEEEVNDTADPFEGGDAAPVDLFVEEGEERKEAKPKPIKSYLFEDDEDEDIEIQEEFNNLPVQDPFSGASAVPATPLLNIE